MRIRANWRFVLMQAIGGFVVFRNVQLCVCVCVCVSLKASIFSLSRNIADGLFSFVHVDCKHFKMSRYHRFYFDVSSLAPAIPSLSLSITLFAAITSANAVTVIINMNSAEMEPLQMLKKMNPLEYFNEN